MPVADYLLFYRMLLAEDLVHALERQLRMLHPGDFHIRKITAVPGGSINRAYRITSGQADYFVKTSEDPKGKLMFLAESQGLEHLRKNGLDGHIPKVYTYGQARGTAFLLMEWIPPGRVTDTAMERLGRALAGIHRTTAPSFGLEYDNYIGSLAQSNHRHTDWADFFISERLEKQVDAAGKKGLIDTRLSRLFEQLYTRIPNLFPAEEPALLHGDLWSGNFLTTANNRPVFIDPAIYYGHREADLAMTLLFGGFSPRFYAAYQENYPLPANWEERVSLWNLYPLLVHLNLFGTSYITQVDNCLHRYC